MDDKEKQKDLERQRVLEQIRKRAEEAELRRIEEEEEKVTSAPAPPEAPAPPPPPPSVVAKPKPAPPPPAAKPRAPEPPPPEPTPEPELEPEAVPLSPHEEKLKDLREKFSIAIDRGKLDRAEDIVDELNAMIDNADEMREYRVSLQKLRDEQAAEKKHAVEKQIKELTGKARDAQEKKIATLFEKANNFYQHEKYDKAQESLDELLALDEDHDEAKELAENVAKARELADRVREDESKRKAEEAALAKPAPPQPPPMSQAPGDAWGIREEKKAEDELGLPPIGDAPKAPPKVPIAERLVERASKIRIPLKPVLIGIGAIILAASVYYIVDSLRQAVFPPKYSLLILPALGTSADSSSQYLAESVTEDLINAIGMVKDLRVIAPATSFSLSGYTGNQPQIARNLGASFFLQWTVAKTGEQIAFQVTLSDTMSSKPVWTSQRQHSIRELQSGTREIALAVLKAMETPVDQTEQQALTTVTNTSGEAYDLYAAGRWFVRQGDMESLNRAIASFTTSMQFDSLFAEAYLGLAWAHLLAVEQDDEGMPQHVTSAWKNLNTAYALGARSAESYRVRGLVALYQSQYDRAREELERGAAFAPSDAETQRRLATLYVLKGRVDDALKAAMHAVADDPRNVESYRLLGMIQVLRGENKEALVNLEQGMRFARDKGKYASEEYADALKYSQQPDRAANILEDRAVHTQGYVEYDKLGRLLQTAGRPKPQWEAKLTTARTLVKSAIAENPEDARAYSHLALIETRLGSFKSAIEANTRAQQFAPFDITVLYNTARMFALQNDKAQSLEALRKAVDKRFDLSRILDMDFYNLRSDPEFQQAVTR